MSRTAKPNADFDFLMGTWKCRHRYLVRRLADCHDWIEFDGSCEVRKILDTLGLTVNRLIRTSFGPFQLLDLLPGGVEPVRRRVLVDQLSVPISRQLGLMDPERETGQGHRPKGKSARKEAR